MLPVRGTLSFWRTVDSVPPGDPLLEEIYDLVFALGEQGPDIPGSKLAQWPFGKSYRPGYSVDFPSGRGFIGDLTVVAANGEFRIALLHLILND